MTPSATPPLHKDDLFWHEQPFWYLLASLACGLVGGVLSLAMFSLARRSALVWILFLYVVGGLVFGVAMGRRYLQVIQALWTRFRRTHRPMWLLPEGRELGLELTGGWILATILGWRLGEEVAASGLIIGLTPDESWFIGLLLGVQFGLWSGVFLTWPLYRWLAGLPRRGAGS